MYSEHYNLDDTENLVFLLYIAFYHDLEKEFGESEDLRDHYEVILEKIKDKNSTIIAKIKKAIKSKSFKIKNSKVKDFKKLRVDTISFSNWIQSEIETSYIFIKSISALEKSKRQESCLLDIRKNILKKEKFEELLKKEPLWELNRAIIYISGFKGFENNEDNKYCVENDTYFKSIYNYAQDSYKISELYLKPSGNFTTSYYHVKPKDIINWAEARFVDSPFLKKKAKA